MLSNETPCHEADWNVHVRAFANRVRLLCLDLQYEAQNSDPTKDSFPYDSHDLAMALFTQLRRGPISPELEEVPDSPTIKYQDGVEAHFVNVSGYFKNWEDLQYQDSLKPESPEPGSPELQKG